MHILWPLGSLFFCNKEFRPFDMTSLCPPAPNSGQVLLAVALERSPQGGLFCD